MDCCYLYYQNSSLFSSSQLSFWSSVWLELIPICEFSTFESFFEKCCSVVSNSLWPYGLWPVRLLCPWNSSGKNTGMGCHVLLQGIFPAQGLNLGLPHCRWILYHQSHQESPYLQYFVLFCHMIAAQISSLVMLVFNLPDLCLIQFSLLIQCYYSEAR